VGSTGRAGYRAHDADVASQGGEPADRPATRAELDYLDARVDETAAAVGKVKDLIKGAERTLAEAERLHADAVRARDAGRDLPAVQKRRAR
jgi:hypothetical protein